MRKLFKYLSIVCIAMVIVACSKSSQIKGNGDIVTRARALAIFDHIRVSGNYALNITAGKMQSVQITADSNLLPYIMTDVKDGQLMINTKKGYTLQSKQPITLNIAVRELKGMDISEQSQAQAVNVSGKAFSLQAAGSSLVGLSGKVQLFSADISGSSQVNAGNLISDNVAVKSSSSGKILVNSSKELDAKISGSGDIAYSGKPEIVRQSASSSGRIQAAN